MKLESKEEEEGKGGVRRARREWELKEEEEARELEEGEQERSKSAEYWRK